MKPDPDRYRYRYTLTPVGSGVLILAMPGLFVAVAAQQPPLISLSIGAGLILLVNGLAARHAVGRPTVTISGPTTVTVGAEYQLRLDISTDRSLECVIAVDGAVRRWVPALLPVAGELAVTAQDRGVLERIGIRLQSSVPLGLVACVRSAKYQLRSPVHVAPAPEPVVLPPMAATDPMTQVYRGDEPLGLRPYVVGDSPRDVHWPSVARTGSMVVRDRRPTAMGTGLDVIIETYGDDCDLDLMLGRARSALEQLFTGGYRIRLVTIEHDIESASSTEVCHAVGLICNVMEIGVRLSQVVIGRPGSLSGSIGPSARLIIRPEGFEWQSSN